MDNGTVFLVGFMGAGKSTVGKLLAAKTGYSFIDLDAAIEIVAGKSINSIFAENGEPAFRKLESTVLHQLLNKTKVIVATGGGCGANVENAASMKSCGTSIYLQVQPGVLFHRLAPQKENRPLISRFTDIGLMEFILDLLPQREPVYLTATKTVNGEKSAEEVAENILAVLNHQSFSGLPERTS